MTGSSSNAQAKLDAKDAKIWNLEDVVTPFKRQLAEVVKVHDRTFAYGYGARVQCLKLLSIANPRTNVLSIDEIDLKSDPISLNGVMSLGQYSIVSINIEHGIYLLFYYSIFY